MKIKAPSRSFVTINGISYKNTVESGSATVTIPANALTAGENNITVTYSGDKNYASKEVKSSINVKKAVPKFTSDVSENNIYGGDVTITVTASSAFASADCALRAVRLSTAPSTIWC